MTTPAVPDLKIAQTIQAFCAEPFPDTTQAKLRIVIEANGKTYEHVLEAAAVKLQPGVKKLMDGVDKLEKKKAVKSARKEKVEKVSSSRKLKEGKDDDKKKDRKTPKTTAHSLPKVEILNSTIGNPNSTTVFGVPLGTLMRRQMQTAPGETIPLFIRDLLKYILENGLEHEGIFRLSAAKSQIDTLKETINKGERAANVIASIPPIVAADLLGAFFRELPSPLIPSDFYESCLQATTLTPPDAVTKRLREIVAELPEPNKSILKELLEVLYIIQTKASQNKMNADNLSRAFGPNILYKPESEMDASDLAGYQTNILRCNTVVRLMIEDFQNILGDRASSAAPTYPLPSPTSRSASNSNASLTPSQAIGFAISAGLPPKVQLVATLSKHEYPIQYITVTPNHREVWSADASGSIKIWDAEKAAYVREIITGQENIFSMLSDEDKLWLASAQSLQVWNASSGALLQEVSSEPTYSLLKVGRSIWTGGSGVVHIYDAPSLTYKQSLPQQGLFMSLAFIDNCVWGGSVEQSILIWNATAPYELVAEINDAHGAKISSVTLVGDTVWTAADDNLIRVWSPKTWELLQNIEVEAGVCDITSFGSEVWACCYDSVIRIWDARNYQCIQELAGHHTDVVVSVVPVSVDMKWMAWSCSTDHIINVFSVRNCTLKRPFRPPAGRGGPVDPGTAGRGRGQPINQRNSKMMVVKDRKKTTDWQTEE